MCRCSGTATAYMLSKAHRPTLSLIEQSRSSTRRQQACVQVRCFLGDNEQRWMLWYSGHARGAQDIDALYPAAGSIGGSPAFSLALHNSGQPLNTADCTAQRMLDHAQSPNMDMEVL